MPTQGTSVSELARARQQFLETGVPPGAELAPHIRRSWSRCVDVAADAPPAEPLPRGALSERRDAAELLLRCAQPELDALAEHVVGHGCVVILSDAAGLILDEIGCPGFLPKARRIALEPGVDWSETRRGTNAIGTALVERAPVMVLGAEHLLPENASIGCAAAPILSARGDLAGVLDISGESVQIDVHALGLVRMAAAQVEHRMLLQRHRAGHDEELVHFHWRAGFLGTPREGLLSVADGRIVGLNRAAAELLQGAWSTWLDRPVEALFGQRWATLRDRPGLLTRHGQPTWAVAVDRPRRTSWRAQPVQPAEPSGPPAEAQAQPAPPPPASAEDALAAQLGRARRVFDAGLSVLITGETGTGKDVFARRLHEASRRAGKPMVAVDCAAIPETLIEAELFGYEEGAFTGARRGGSPGRIREAHGGVLFLDEIGDMPLPLQARLLRVLETRRVRPLGSGRDVEVDFALVCATHRNLAVLAREGRFRDDLLYRLRGYEVQLPPLRRRDDRRRLIDALLRELGAAAQGIRLSPQAVDRLDRHAWPGNVRELAATLRAALALAEPGAEIQAAELPIADTAEPPPADAAPLSTLTQQAVRRALDDAKGNVAAAARALGIHRSTLYRYIERGR
ncbi:MAG: sigma-54-dependent Fis family transcriptional regulator [Rubrivivax sp.]